MKDNDVQSVINALNIDKIKNKTFWTKLKSLVIGTTIILCMLPIVSWFYGTIPNTKYPYRLGVMFIFIWPFVSLLFDLIGDYFTFIYVNNGLSLRNYTVRNVFYKYYFHIIVIYNIVFIATLKLWNLKYTSSYDLILFNFYIGFLLIVMWILQNICESQMNHNLWWIIAKKKIVRLYTDGKITLKIYELLLNYIKKVL